jgi:hypothetical protein
MTKAVAIKRKDVGDVARARNSEGTRRINRNGRGDFDLYEFSAPLTLPA